MKFFDIVLINIYKFLTLINLSSLYNGNQKEARLHAYIVHSGIFGLNVFNILSYVYFIKTRSIFPEYLAVIILILSFACNYYIYYTKGRFSKIFNSKIVKKNILHYLITFLYILSSFSIMFLTSYYIRNNYNG